MLKLCLLLPPSESLWCSFGLSQGSSHDLRFQAMQRSEPSAFGLCDGVYLPAWQQCSGLVAVVASHLGPAGSPWPPAACPCCPLARWLLQELQHGPVPLPLSLPPPFLPSAPSPPSHRGLPLPLRCLSEVSRAAMARGPARACPLGQGPAPAVIAASPCAWLWQRAQASLRYRRLSNEGLKGNCPFNPSA